MRIVLLAALALGGCASPPNGDEHREVVLEVRGRNEAFDIEKELLDAVEARRGK